MQQKQSKSGKRNGSLLDLLKSLQNVTDCNNTEGVTIQSLKVPNLTYEESKSLGH